MPSYEYVAIVPYEARSAVVVAETRFVVVPYEPRPQNVPDESRVAVVPAESRTVRMEH